ncbi:hypothetical protein J6590_072450 [Homalodisca vitripennis]|nr:hypothetical protein J6590_072450 [Homalodisca vitripennis]
MAVFDNEIERWGEVDVPYLHLSSSEDRVKPVTIGIPVTVQQLVIHDQNDSVPNITRDQVTLHVSL